MLPPMSEAVPLLAVAAALCVLAVGYRWLRRWWMLSRLPRMRAAVLTRDALIAASHQENGAGLLRLPGKHGVLVTDPRLARRLLEQGGGDVVRDITAYDRYAGFLGSSLVLLPQATPTHRAIRTSLLPLFSVGATRRAHTTLLECTRRCLDSIEAKSAGRPDRAVPLHRLLQHFVLDVTTRCFLAKPISDADGRRLIVLFEEWLENPPEPPRRDWRCTARRWWAGGDSPPSSDRLQRAYDAILDRLCSAQAEAEAARAAEGGDDSSLLDSASVLEALGCGASMSEVRAQSAGLLFAGLNSAKELHSMLSMLAKHEGLQADARAEVDNVLRGQLPSYADLSAQGGGGSAAGARVAPQLELCARLVNEALRLAPGIEHLRLLTRRTTRVTVGGTQGDVAVVSELPRGTRVVVSPALLHKHPAHWPQPCDKPRPELFTPAAQAARSPGCFLPFSAGAKGCPAAGFALHEMRMLLVLTLQRFELREAPAGGVCVALRQESSGAAAG